MQSAQTKKEYTSPALTVYGSVRDLTKGGGGTKSEAGRYAGTKA